MSLLSAWRYIRTHPKASSQILSKISKTCQNLASIRTLVSLFPPLSLLLHFRSFFSLMTTTTSITVALFSLLVVLFFSFRKPKASRASLPPGPKPLPLLGNITDLPLKELWLPAFQWAKKYGTSHPIFTST